MTRSPLSLPAIPGGCLELIRPNSYRYIVFKCGLFYRLAKNSTISKALENAKSKFDYANCIYKSRILSNVVNNREDEISNLLNALAQRVPCFSMLSHAVLLQFINCGIDKWLRRIGKISHSTTNAKTKRLRRRTNKWIGEDIKLTCIIYSIFLSLLLLRPPLRTNQKCSHPLIEDRRDRLQ